LLEVRKSNNKKGQIYGFDFECVAKNMNRRLNICTDHISYDHVLPFLFYIFLRMIATLVALKKP
jgi:hypothetical protein